MIKLSPDEAPLLLQETTLAQDQDGYIEKQSSSKSWSFYQILDHIDLGILVLDFEAERIEYRNPNFFHVLADPFLCDDYDALSLLFAQHLDLRPESPVKGALCGKIKLIDRVIVCSVYHFAERFRCFTLRDITERARLETIAQAVNSTDSLGFVFSGIRHEIGNPLNSLKSCWR